MLDRIPLSTIIIIDIIQLLLLLLFLPLFLTSKLSLAGKNNIAHPQHHQNAPKLSPFAPASHSENLGLILLSSGVRPESVE